MAGSVDADPATLDELRQRLFSFNDRQVAALNDLLADLTRTQLELEDARNLAEREVRRCESALVQCRAVQAMAAAASEYVDCSRQEAALDEAQQHLHLVLTAIAEVRSAGERYRNQDHAHRSFLGRAIPAMRTGLEARLVSLEAYLAWSVGLTNAFRSETEGGADALTAIAEDLSNKTKYESFRFPMPPEHRDGDRGGPERMG